MSTNPIAAIGPRNGYKTPMNVFAHTGEATSEQHTARTIDRAIDRFFTRSIPQRWKAPDDRV
jgi:hypothetical protein